MCYAGQVFSQWSKPNICGQWKVWCCLTHLLQRHDTMIRHIIMTHYQNSTFIAVIIITTHEKKCFRSTGHLCIVVQFWRVITNKYFIFILWCNSITFDTYDTFPRYENIITSQCDIKLLTAYLLTAFGHFNTSKCLKRDRCTFALIPFLCRF